ncbi:MAG: hypothetical protein HOV68_29370 [Streptomycetaceae bacterium]|nr:hypothetical protein [Streptomycetaceae bacterium]
MVPPVEVPYVPQCSPYYGDDFKAGSDGWISGYGLADAESDYVRFACLAFPTTARRARLRWLCDFYQWLFAVDDLLDSPARLGADPAAVRLVTGQLRGVVDGVVPPRAYGRAFADLWARIIPDLSPPQVDRLAGYVVDYCDGLEFMAVQRARRTVPSPAVYAEMRRKESIMYLCMTFVEYATEHDLTGHLTELDETRRVFADYAIVNQDLLSFRKEHAEGDQLNSIDVHRLAYGVPVQEALDAVGAGERELRQHSEELIARHTDLMGPCADGYRHFIAGYMAWTLTSHRY